MSFLRRVFGGGAARPDAADAADEAEDGLAERAPEDPDDEARERALLAEDAKRLSDGLLARQLRYADRAWSPPAEGGERRADDAQSRQGS